MALGGGGAAGVEEARRIARRFADGGEPAHVAPFAGGHIHASFVVTLRGAGGEARGRILLQRINERVFPAPRLVMENVERITAHLHDGLSLVRADDGASHARDDAGGWWRAYRFLEGTRAFEAPSTPAQAYAAAFAFGRFQRDLADLAGPRLHETIPGFHDTPARVAAFERALARDGASRAERARPEIDGVLARRDLADALLAPFRRGEIPERVVHNDAKMSNVLFDVATGDAVCVVDLDTVMPGLALYDFGDMARSMASPAAEDERDLARVVARPEFFVALARGYVGGAGPLLSARERELLVTAAKVITYEQLVRFLADFLDGDRYYAVSRPEQNLDRARTQLALLRSFEAQEGELARLVDAAGPAD